MNYLADKSYLAVKPQADADTPIIPDVFMPLVSESIKVVPNFAADRRMKGLDWKSDEILKGSRKIEGDVSVYADPDNLAHIVNMVYAKGETTGSAGDGYTHPFTPGEGKNYSLDIPRGIYAQRIWGVRGDNLKLEFQDNKLVATISIKALGQFYTASLAVALTGTGMTSCVLKTDYDLRPTDGLKIGDKILIGAVELTLTSVNADGKTLGFASTTVTASIGDAVFLKAQTPTLPTQREPFYMGNALVGVALTSALADTAAASKATATPCYSVGVNLKNNLLDSPASGSTGPISLKNQVKEASLDLKRMFEDPTEYQRWIEAVKRGVTIICTGRFIKSDLTTSEKLTVKFHNVKTLTNDDPLEPGSYIFDTQNFEALYDSVDGKTVEIEIINRITASELGDDES